MTDSAIKRFKTRRAIQAKLAIRPRLALVPALTNSDAPRKREVDHERINAILKVNELDWDRNVSRSEVNSRIAELGTRFDRERTEAMWDDCRRDVLLSIAGPFGVGKIVSAFDKTGGNVDTVHNARSGIYATENERLKHANRVEYDATSYHANKNYIAANERNSSKLEKGSLVDAYTGESFHPSDKNDEQSKPNLDHTVAAKNIHDDAGRNLADLDGPTLANMDVNLNATSASVNKSKKAKTAKDFIQYLESTSSERKARIKEFEAKGLALTDQERKQLSMLQKLEKVDPKRLNQKEAAALAAIDKKINWTYYTSSKFANNLARTSATEGVKMGVQQAFGEVLVEFFVAVFDEINDWFKNGREDGSLLKEIKARLLKIARRCEKKLEAALAAFKQGFLSGFFSNLVTTLINAFATTGKRLVRMIREGFFSLMRGIEMLLFPPDGMSFREAAHEASKILLAGGLVIGAIPLEDWMEKQLALVPLLSSMAGIASAAIVGALTAVVTAFGVYLLDHADLFGVNRDRRCAGTIKLLDASIANTERRIEMVLAGPWIINSGTGPACNK
ncbi:hypothetical protein GALL_167410 [mine drainage metagenome]|uniref:Uncharacterized protein n=1 Tax=mine drainage metagenome TaxID=410659 RepID=A0A1J5SAQ0_9ZZZZ